MSGARIRKLVQGVHMGLGHDGLKHLLKKSLEKGGADIDVESLNSGDLVMCINKQGDKLKVIGSRGLVLGYLKMPKGKRIMLDALRLVPETFGASGFNYSEALKKTLEERLGRGRPRTAGPLDAARAAKQAGV